MTQNPFPSMKATALLAMLMREPLNYRIVRQRGSHRKLEADGRLPIIFAYHDGATCARGVVRKVLTERAGLTEDEARDLL